MKRLLSSHKLAGLNEALEIRVMDDPGHGGACHEYEIHKNVEEWDLAMGQVRMYGVLTPEALLRIERLGLSLLHAGVASGIFASLEIAEQSLKNRTFTAENVEFLVGSLDYRTLVATIRFQNGPIGENGVNGLSGEALLSIVEDRLVCFQAGGFSCRENAVALTKVQESLMWLQKQHATDWPEALKERAKNNFGKIPDGRA